MEMPATREGAPFAQLLELRTQLYEVVSQLSAAVGAEPLRAGRSLHLQRRQSSWCLSWGDRELPLRDCHALRYLAVLTQQPNEQVPALALFAEARGLTVEAAATAHPTGSRSPTDRASAIVTRSLRSFVRSLEAVDPALAAHLDLAVTTGACCCYAVGPYGRIS